MTSIYYVYILNCENGSLYTGYTNDLERRYCEHITGAGSKYTRAFKPVGIAQVWEVEDKNVAMKIEYYIKKQNRRQKEKLITEPHFIESLFCLNKESVYSNPSISISK